ncbi:MAG: M23 family metallopeptidase [Spirochaetaceae bacterium]
MKTTLVTLILLLLAAMGVLIFEPFRATPEEPLVNRPTSGDSWYEYLRRMHTPELAATALSRRWQRAGEASLRHAVPIDTPYRESITVEGSREVAHGYRLDLRHGEELTVTVARGDDSGGELLFVDLLEIDRHYGGFANPLVGERTHTAGRSEALRFTAMQDGEFLLRLQGRPMTSVTFILEVSRDPVYHFPVEGAGPQDIWSVFGDARGGGRRIHHGIDIFAPRGTVLLAATDAYVARIGNRTLGGRIVTLHDRQRDIYLYYAHLENWLVEEGQFVRSGEPIGTMGNTGNARFTPPHLHIGLYSGWWSRPIDPWNFFVPIREGRPLSNQPILADGRGSVELGAGVEAMVFTDGQLEPKVLTEELEVRVIGVSDELVRVVLEDGIPALVSREQLR